MSQVSFYVTLDQRKQIEAAAEEDFESVSTFCRKIIMSYLSGKFTHRRLPYLDPE